MESSLIFSPAFEARLKVASTRRRSLQVTRCPAPMSPSGRQIARGGDLGLGYSSQLDGNVINVFVIIWHACGHLDRLEERFNLVGFRNDYMSLAISARVAHPRVGRRCLLSMFGIGT